MKCPFKKVTEYFRRVKYNSLLSIKSDIWESCTVEQAEKIEESFSDCYENDCFAFKAGDYGVVKCCALVEEKNGQRG
jgi:hypothetical protein